jgi:hypothetical protein
MGRQRGWKGVRRQSWRGTDRGVRLPEMRNDRSSPSWGALLSNELPELPDENDQEKLRGREC